MPFADLPRIRLHYLERGTGEPVLFLHGFTIDHRMWTEPPGAIPFDFSKRFHSIIPDMRGHGLSEAPPDNYARTERVADLIELLDFLKIEQCHVVGLSMGGSTGIGMALSNPQRMKSLTLVSTGAAGYNVGQKISKLDSMAVEQGLEPARQQWAEWSSSYYIKKERTDVSSLLTTMITEHSGAVWLDPMRGRYPKTNDLDHVHTIAVATLIMSGLDDKIFVPLARQLHEKIPNSRLIEYESTGHMINMEIPSRFYTDLAVFLDEKH